MRELEHVIGVAAVGEAASGGDQSSIAQPAQVVGDQALPVTGELAQLAHAPIAARQLAQEPPAQRVPGQAEELRR